MTRRVTIAQLPINQGKFLLKTFVLILSPIINCVEIDVVMSYSQLCRPITILWKSSCVRSFQ